MYSDTLTDHFHHPRNVGEIDKPDGSADGENPICGDQLHVELRIQADVIVEFRWRAAGCPPTIAAASAASVALEGCSVHEAREFDRSALAAALDGVPDRKSHALTLVLSTVARALDSCAPRP